MTRSRALALVLLAAGVAGGCGKESGGAPAAAGRRQPMAFPVEVAPVAAQRVDYAVQAVGSVEAFERVQVTARVAGAVDQVRFAEGDEVGKGKVLVEIETERYRLGVDAAAAAVAKSEAAVADATAGLARRERAQAQAPGLIPGEEIETWRTRLRTGEAERAQAKTALQQARLNLREAYVRSPVAGVIETRAVQTGQYVQPGTVLATLVQREPLLLRFQVPNSDAARLHPGMTARFRVRSDPREHQAEITHVAGAADAASRMVAVTARIVHPAAAATQPSPDADAPGTPRAPVLDAALRPGAFAEVAISVGAGGESPVVPQTAIRPSERGFLAYVIIDSVAHERTLSLGMRTADGLVEVKDGLTAGEQLVVRGGEALRDGATVTVAGSEPAPPAPPAEAKAP